MEHIEKILIILAGIILALLLISKGFGLWIKASEGVDSAGEQIDALTQKLDTEAYLELGGRTDIPGSTVSAFISEHKQDYNRKIVLTNGTSSVTFDITTVGQSAVDTAYGKTKNKKDASYINPSSLYSAVVAYNTDSTIASITFTKN